MVDDDPVDICPLSAYFPANGGKYADCHRFIGLVFEIVYCLSVGAIADGTAHDDYGTIACCIGKLVDSIE